RIFDLAEDSAEFLVRELGRRRQLDIEDALVGGDEHIELVDDLRQLARASLLREQAEEVDDLVVGTLGDARKHVGLHGRLDLGIREHRPKLVDPCDGVAQLLHLAVDELEPVLVLRSLEQRARVDAVRDRYDRLPSSSEKSISASASSIRGRLLLSVSGLRVIFSAAAWLC